MFEDLRKSMQELTQGWTPMKSESQLSSEHQIEVQDLGKNGNAAEYVNNRIESHRNMTPVMQLWKNAGDTLAKPAATNYGSLIEDIDPRQYGINLPGQMPITYQQQVQQQAERRDGTHLEMETSHQVGIGEAPQQMQKHQPTDIGDVSGIDEITGGLEFVPGQGWVQTS